jgi:hypothetical protein
MVMVRQGRRVWAVEFEGYEGPVILWSGPRVRMILAAVTGIGLSACRAVACGSRGKSKHRVESGVVALESEQAVGGLSELRRLVPQASDGTSSTNVTDAHSRSCGEIERDAKWGVQTSLLFRCGHEQRFEGAQDLGLMER